MKGEMHIKRTISGRIDKGSIGHNNRKFIAPNVDKNRTHENIILVREDIQKTYLPMGFSNFKIEGRGLGSAIILEFLLYYMTKPEHQLEVREAVYLDSMLDLF